MKFIPSQKKAIRFPDGKVVTMNRKERRQAKIFNRMLVPDPTGGKNPS